MFWERSPMSNAARINQLGPCAMPGDVTWRTSQEDVLTLADACKAGVAEPSEIPLARLYSASDVELYT